MIEMRGTVCLVAGFMILILGNAGLAQSPASANFKQNCAVCHGDSGHGDGPAGKALAVPSFTDPVVLRKSDADLTHVIKNGSGKMPPFQGRLQDQDIANLIHFVHQLQGKK
jgi:mono/diheme cytochrome c family protein